MSHEIIALVKLLRVGVGGGLQGYDDLDGIEWTKLFESARRHQVEGLVYDVLDRSGREKDMLAEARMHFVYARHLGGLLHERIRPRVAEILRAAARECIEVMLLKGIVLAYSAYERCEHRGMCDVDILVRERDFTRLRVILGNNGYRTSIPRLDSRDLPWYAHCREQVRFRRRGAVPVETHFRLLNLGMPAAREEAWEDASAHEFAGIRTACPSPERFLLHLCLHAQQHAFSSLRYFVDIAVWNRSHEIDTERFVALARRHHLGAAAFYALTYTADLLGLPGSEAIRARLKPGAWRRGIFEFLWQDRRVRSQRVRAVPGNVELPRAFLLGEAPVREKLVFLWNVLVPWKKRRELTGGHGGSRCKRGGRILVEAWRALAGIARICRG
jgi:hypothetical protein